MDDNNELVTKINLTEVFRSKIQEMVDIINQIRSEKKYTNPIEQDTLIDSITQILLYNNYCEGGEYDIDYVLETNDVIADEFFYLIIPEIYEQFSYKVRSQNDFDTDTISFQMRLLSFYEIPANTRNAEIMNLDTFEDFKSELINLFISLWREKDSIMAPEEAAPAPVSAPAPAPVYAPAPASETKEEDSIMMEDTSIEPTVQQTESPSYEPQTKRQRKQGGGRKCKTRKKNKIKTKNRNTRRKKRHNKKSNTRKSKRVKKNTRQNKKRN